MTESAASRSAGTAPAPQPTGRCAGGRRLRAHAAHLAAITYQRPYRVLLHADLLLPDGDR